MGVGFVLQFISVGNLGAFWSETAGFKWKVGYRGDGWGRGGGRRGAELVISHREVFTCSGV